MDILIFGKMKQMKRENTKKEVHFTQIVEPETYNDTK